MGLAHGVGVWPLALAAGLAGALAHRNYMALPALPGVRAEGGHVSIVVPARNEADRIAPLLRSLQRIEYAAYEVVVVDDGSVDGTGDIARRLGARVITIAGPPRGWTGKTHACWVGAQATTGEWLLFTDADTVHSPSCLSRALAAAGDAALVSLLPRQVCASFWERLLLPYAYALYFAGAWHVNRPGGPAVANGQYLLFRRDVYLRLGGHGAVRASVIEDVALARHLRATGEQVLLLRAEDDLQVRMYPNLPSLWEGFAKNAARFAAVEPRTGVPTALAGVAFLWTLPAASGSARPGRWAALALPTLALLPWYTRFGVPRSYSLLFPLAAATFQAIALDSARCWLLGKATWRGRRV